MVRSRRRSHLVILVKQLSVKQLGCPCCPCPCPSNTCEDYRNQAEVLNTSQIVRANKIQAENKVTFAFDDIAKNIKTSFETTQTIRYKVQIVTTALCGLVQHRPYCIAGSRRCPQLLTDIQQQAVKELRCPRHRTQLLAKLSASECNDHIGFLSNEHQVDYSVEANHHWRQSDGKILTKVNENKRSIGYPSDQIRSDQIRSDQIRSDQIRSDQIRSDQIRSDQIRSDQIRSDQIRSDQIRSDQIRSDQIRSDQIRSDQIRSDQIRSDQIRSDQIRSDQIRSDQIRSDQIRSDQIRSDQIRSDQIRSDQIRSDQIRSDQIRSDQIRSDQIRSDQISSVQFRSDHIRSGRRAGPLALPGMSDPPAGPNRKLRQIDSVQFTPLLILNGSNNGIKGKMD
ncbi:hypothetical protein T265_09852 [Opisthorchis viverrini]|uniref:Uncharacterized protein n=1 Tax=Opisthorchis viverrini TaxID=6198 RepID=A0A075A3F3_OPIVI|nr:hypothetical protein T265_09852 [Opisthorchis viverrini]KER21934.1 hypothetical protein T265_09852 [Opisthorchis viverrini]